MQYGERRFDGRCNFVPSKENLSCGAQQEREKRIIRRKAEKFSLETGELLYTMKKDKTKVASYSQVQKIRSTVNGQNNRISSR